MKRRTYLKRGLQSMALLACEVKLPAAHAAAPSALPNLEALPAFLDILIPEDTTPSASQLGLHGKLIQHAKGIENYTRLLELGCQLLDGLSQARYRVNFNALAPAQGEPLVMMVEASPKGSIPEMFFTRVLSDLFGFYYSHPASWPGLGLDSPPQPNGYPDYAKPMQRRTLG